MSVKHITVKDPEGRNLDLTRPFIRHINFKFPEDYDGATVPTVTQTTIFTREADRDDKGHLSFTEWHSNNAYWASYPVPVINGLTPNVSEVPSENLNMTHEPVTEYTVAYEQDGSKNDSGTPASDHQESIIDNPDSSSGNNSTNETLEDSETAGLMQGVNLLDQLKAQTTEKAAERKPISQSNHSTATTSGTADTPSQSKNLATGNSEPNVSKDARNAVDSAISDTKNRAEQQASLATSLTFDKRQPLTLPANLMYLLKDNSDAQLLDTIAVVGRFSYTEHGYQLTPFAR